MTAITKEADEKTIFLAAYKWRLSDAERDSFPEISGYNRRYIECHLAYGYKTPRDPAAMGRIYRAFQGNITWAELLTHFYGNVMNETTGGTVKLSVRKT